MKAVESDALIKRICDECGCGCECVYDCELIKPILRTPTIEVELVRHGFNVRACSPSMFECSECGWECWDTYCCDGEFKYCPRCSAKMDGNQ